MRAGKWWKNTHPTNFRKLDYFFGLSVPCSGFFLFCMQDCFLEEAQVPVFNKKELKKLQFSDRHAFNKKFWRILWEFTYFYIY